MAVLIQFDPMIEATIVVVCSDVSGEGLASADPDTVIMTPTVTVNGTPTTNYTLTVLSSPLNGTAQTSPDNKTLWYSPTPSWSGNDSFTYKATSGSTASNVATASIQIDPAVVACKELGRTTKTYVTGYSLSRVNVARVRRMAKRCVVANFNGALDPSRSIVSVRWETTSPWSIFMSNARIAPGQRETMVDVSFNFSGWGGLLATVTLDNGEIYNAEFSFTVLDTPLYPSATYPLGNGPFRLDASV